MIVMGIDPGSQKHAWAILGVQGRAPGLYLEHGIADDIDAMIAKIRDNRTRVLPQRHEMLVAIETPSHYIPRSKGNDGATFSQASALMAMMAHVGEIRRACKDLVGVEMVELTGAQWRVPVAGVANAPDARIAAAITELVNDWPKRSNAHHRDAAGVALAAAWGVRAPVRPEAPRSPKSSKRAQIVSRSLRAKMAQRRKKSEGGKGAQQAPAVSRARASAEQVAARVDRLEELMRRGEFVPETARQWERLLAEEWGVSVSMVRQHAAEASRRVRSGWRKPKAIRRDVLTKLQRAYWRADEQGDAKGMTAAALATAKIAGVEAPQKVAITDAAGEDLPPQLRELARVGDMAALTRFFATGELPPKSGG